MIRWKPLPSQEPSSDPLLDWLFHRGSLTARLQALDPSLSLEVVAEGPGHALEHEWRLLRCASAAGAWIREIVMGPAGDRAWVLARTVVSPPLMHARGPRLVELGRRPLGAMLFRDPSFRRTAMHYARLARGEIDRLVHLRPLLAPLTTSLWARCSRWVCEEDPLLVTEIFTDELWRFLGIDAAAAGAAPGVDRRA